MSLLFVVFVVATFAAVSMAVRSTWPARSRAEHLLLVLLFVVMSVEVEVQVLSWTPVDAPLRAWPWVHGVLVVAVFAATRGCGRPGSPPWRGTRLSLLERGVVTLVGIALLGTLVWGAITKPGGVDELAYHVPQAGLINQYQDLNRPFSQLPWTYAYPRGGPVLWSSTMQFLKDDRGFRLVQLALGFQFLLAMYVVARRSRAGRLPALLGALGFASAPVFFRMTTLSTADMGYAAGIVTMIAFLAPAGSAATRHADLRLAVIGLAQAAVFKAPALAVMIAVALVLLRGDLRSTLRSLVPASRIRLGIDVGVVVVLVISCWTYLVNMREYHNPFYPLNFSVAGHHFTGPLPQVTDAGTGGHTSWGEIPEMSRIHLWVASFLDWDEPLNEDSFGSIGPTICLLIALGLIPMLVLAVRRRDRWLVAVTAVTGGCVLGVPALFLPRYSMPVVALLIALSAVGMEYLQGRARFVVVSVVAVVSAAAAIPSVDLARNTLEFYRHVVPHDRDYYRIDLAEPARLNAPEIAQSPKLVSFVRDHVGDGERLVYDISTYPALLWNEDFSNEIHFVPLSAGETYPASPFLLVPPTPTELMRFLATVREIDPEWVVLYTRSEAVEAVSGLGYTPAYADPASDGKFAVTVLRASVPSAAA